MDTNPKRLTREEHIGREFNGRIVVSVRSERMVGQTLIRVWLLRCQRCGLEQHCDQRRLRRTRCYSNACRGLPENKSFKKPKNKNPIPRMPEKRVPSCNDPRWEELVVPVFNSLPLHPHEITRSLTRQSLAWMESHEMVAFDMGRMVWEEHPEHLKKRLIAAAKAPIA